MKKEWIILLIAAVATPALARQTNNPYHRSGGTHESNTKQIDVPPRTGWTEEQRKEHMERRYQFMDKALSEIGVSEEDRIIIRKLQETHRAEMKSSGERLKAAQSRLAELLDAGATNEEVEVAIKAVSEAQTQQLRLIVGNRRQMEKLLGREKYALFMENARSQFYKHGRRGGSGMPPRPGLPPIPGQDNGSKGRKYPPVPGQEPKTPPPPPMDG